MVIVDRFTKNEYFIALTLPIITQDIVKLSGPYL